MKWLFINGNFRNVLFARIISFAGTTLQNTALALYVIDKEATVGALATMLSLVIIPQVLFGPVGGLVADRFNKRSIMMVSDWFGFCVAFLLYLSVHNNRIDISYIYLSSVLLSLSVVFFAPAIDSIFPQIINKEELTKGNSIYNGSLDVVQVIAPMLGAVVYSLAGIKYIFLVNAISFFVSGLLLFKVKIEGYHAAQSTTPVCKNKLVETLKSLFKPVEIFIKDKTLRNMMVFNYITAIFVLPLMTIGFVSLLKRTLELDNYFFGCLQSILVAGAFLGAVIVNKMSKSRTSLQCISSSLFLLTVVLFLQSLCIYAYNGMVINRYLMYALVLVLGFFLSFILRLFYIPMHVIVQSNTKIEHLGRVSSFYWMLSLIAQPIGQFYISYFIDHNYFALWLALSSMIILATFFYSRLSLNPGGAKARTLQDQMVAS